MKKLFTQSNSRLEFVLNKALHLDKLNRLIQATLPTPLLNHTRLANVRDGQLILQVSNAAMATQVRFYGAEILQKLKKEAVFKRLKTIKVIVDPINLKSAPLEGDQNISKESSAIINKGTETIKHQGLKEALKQLSGKQKKTKN